MIDFDKLARNASDALSARTEAGYRQGAFVHDHFHNENDLRDKKDDAHKAADKATRAFWGEFYDLASEVGATIRALTTEAERFFHEHAGWSYHPDFETPEEGRWRGARKLATAEDRGRTYGWTVEWAEDEDPIDDDVERDEDYSQYVAVLYDEDENLLACLGSVDLGPTEAPESEPYARVIAAELMLEALATIDPQEV